MVRLTGFKKGTNAKKKKKKMLLKTINCPC